MHDFLPSLLIFLERSQRTMVLALRSLWLHKLRAFLSVLGIIIGTAAVISLMAFGEGSMQDALDDIMRQGATNIIVKSIKPPDDSSNQRRTMVVNYGLTKKDLDWFETWKKNDPLVERLVPMRIFPQEVRRRERMQNGSVVATTHQYQEVNKFDLAIGRFLTKHDDENMLNVAVLGSALAEYLFPFENPLGNTIVLNKHQYIVVGVISDRIPTGTSGSRQAPKDFNNDVYIPLNTCQGRFGDKIYIRQSGSRSGEQVELHQITLTISDKDPTRVRQQVKEAGASIQKYLESKHYKSDWDVNIPLERLEELERSRIRSTMLLLLIGAISLLVAGIGIMNIMLATVTERTREIGIRRALGAKRRDITMQFLIEAMVQTGIGGLCGVLLALTVYLVAPFVAEVFFDSKLPAKLNVLSIYLSLGMAIFTGVLFGLYPAMRASRLDPIEALRHE